MKDWKNHFMPRCLQLVAWLTIGAVLISSHTAFAGTLILDGGHAFISSGPAVIDSPNPQQLALKRRYIRMNSSANFSLGHSPSGIAFDGANIWVVSKNDSKLDVLRANNGDFVVKDKAAPNCTWPTSMAYDGKNMWVTCLGDDHVAVLDGSDPINNSLISPVTVGSAPVYIFFDGEFMWVTCDGSESIYIINTNDFSVATKALPSVGGSHLAYGMASDGTNIWVVNRNYYNVNVFRISDRTRISMSPDQGSNALDVEFDGVNMWITNLEDDQVTILKASDGSYVKTLYTTDGVGDKPTYLFFDGLYMWVVNETDGTASIFRAHDFTYMTKANVGSNAQRIAFDGANMWILSGGANNVVKR